MSTPIFKGPKFVFGIQELKPIIGAPDGRRKLVMRHNCIARFFVRSADGIRHYALEDRGDHWYCNPDWLQGGNFR
jgi:hypothetical protein